MITNNAHLRLSTIVVSLIAVVMCAGFARAADNDIAAIQTTLLENAGAFERNDVAALDKLWAQDDSVIVFESGYADYGWKNYRDHHLIPEMAELKNTKYTLSDIKPHVAGETAWATFKYAISGDLPERHVEGSGLGTAVLEKRDGRWVIVHWHSSSPPKKPATPAPDIKN